MKDDYAGIAPIYSRLSRLVFGSTLDRANRWFLEGTGAKSVLIIGGGDGSAYVDMAGALRGEFWEKSSAMLRLAKDNLAKSALSFHSGDFESQIKADFILLPFVLDTLTDLEMEKMLLQLRAHLNPGGKLGLSDFFPAQNLFQKVVFWAMILFFRIFTAHSRRDLPDYGRYLARAGYRLQEEKIWRKGWIRAQAWVLD